MSQYKWEISFANVISGRCYDHGWRNMTEEERADALEKIKGVLLSECRGDSQISRAIKRMSLDNLPKNIGIYERLRVDGYCAGQSYPDEIRYIKLTIKHQC